MAGGAGSSSDDEPISAINVTPLVDVMLVLLVIFMVAAPVIYQSAIKVDLPEAQTGEKSDSSPLDFTITASGGVMWGKETLDWKIVEDRLIAMEKSLPGQTATISADKATPHGAVVRLMDLLRKRGLIRFALNVDGKSP